MEEMSGAYSHYLPPPAAPAYDCYSPPPPIPGVAPLPPYHHHHHQPPPPHYSLPRGPPPSHLEPSSDEVRTLFIAGLPDDVKAREIYNLFREFPGFESSQLRSAGTTRAYAFAVFIDQQSAVTAIQSLNGLSFDLEKESTLYINFAKSNSRKRLRTDDGMPYSPDKRSRGTVAYSRSYLHSGVGSNIHMPGMGNPAYSINAYPSTQSLAIYDYGTDPNKPGMGNPAYSINAYPFTQSQTIYDYGTDPNKPMNISSTNIPRNSDPCSTLFVANLGPTCSEQELTDIFSRCPGFSKLKMQKKNGLPVAFVDFKDVASSTGALNHLQGTHLYLSVGGGMRLDTQNHAWANQDVKGERRSSCDCI